MESLAPARGVRAIRPGPSGADLNNISSPTLHNTLQHTDVLDIILGTRDSSSGGPDRSILDRIIKAVIS